MPYAAIPSYITVHLGAPSSNAENVTVSFIDYIKNVASGEIYPTWPEEALRANIYAQISYAINRVYTEWYPTQGYDFDITSITQFDQTYEPGREIFANISAIVDEIFNDYVVQQGSVVPYFTAYCNGTTSVCAGLSQWGTVPLAEQGMTALEILRYYYGEDIEIVYDAPVEDYIPSYPGFPLQRGDVGEEVWVIQRQLNRIGANFPAIPHIEIGDGVFDGTTEEAVQVFQQVFDLPQTGVVDKATWYSIKRRFLAVTGLCELVSEGLSIAEAERIYPSELNMGDAGQVVRTLQYYLSFLGSFVTELPLLTMSGIFDAQTGEAVRAFQARQGLPQTGVVDLATWNTIVTIYSDIVDNLPSDFQAQLGRIYPGYYITIGTEGQSVIDIQEAINIVAEYEGTLPKVEVTGIYDEATAEAIRQLQTQEGITSNGVVGPLTWQALMYRRSACSLGTNEE